MTAVLLKRRRASVPVPRRAGRRAEAAGREDPEEQRPPARGGVMRSGIEERVNDGHT